MRETESGLFPALEKALQKATKPLDCGELYEMPAIKRHAASVNRVSDYLGNLWRKGRVVRLPPKDCADGRSRWQYQWKGDREPAPESVEHGPRVLAERPSMRITENGSVVTIDLPNMVISIKQKKVSGFAYLESLPKG